VVTKVTDLTEPDKEVVEWIDLTQNWDRCQTVVHAVINHRVMNGGNMP
jgi:hypothetical protein